jgi:isoleucyl-tRNA synthetase
MMMMLLRRRRMSSKNEFGSTILLPNGILSQRASSVEQRYRKRTTTELYKSQWARNIDENQNRRKIFVCHDGPPYANGPAHIGHALNKVAKDIANRYRVLRGHRVHFVPGWDCHGLPIENAALANAERDRGELDPVSLRKLARKTADKAVRVQQAAFERWAVMADWSEFESGKKKKKQNEWIYRTMDAAYECAQLDVFWRMFESGAIYRGLKPVHWSPSSGTALADAELEYGDAVSPSIYVRFPMTLANGRRRVDALVWTTTPWTLPANRALCVGADLDYALVVDDRQEASAARPLLVAVARIDALRAEGVLSEHARVERAVRGAELRALVERVERPLDFGNGELAIPLIEGAHVTSESGTGIVHTAPGHGLDDWMACARHSIEPFCPVDEAGRYTASVGAAELRGLDAVGDGSRAVVDMLRDAGALAHGPVDYVHRFPFDWRTNKPVMVRATEQWFARLDDGVKRRAIDALRGVTMVPESGGDRLRTMIEARNDWCISRQRVWGVPIPVFYERDSGAPLIDVQLVEHARALVAEHGTDCWYWMSDEQLMPTEWRLLAERGIDASQCVRGTDTMDVWFDSGSSWARVVAGNDALRQAGCAEPAVADLVIEGTDQHRGWFQSSLLTRAALGLPSPYRTVVTHGFVLDERGRKMSKSIGNVVDPADIIDGRTSIARNKPLGVDGMRLWIASNRLGSADVSLSGVALEKSASLARRFRNTLRWLVGNLTNGERGFDALGGGDQHVALSALDRWMLDELAELEGRVVAGYEAYQSARVVQALAEFVSNPLSGIYVEAVKDRLYCDAEQSERRVATQYVLSRVLATLTKSLAPIMCHLAEEVHDCVPQRAGVASVFESGWIDASSSWSSTSSSDRDAWQRLFALRNAFNRRVEHARADGDFGSALEIELHVSTADAQLVDFLREHVGLADCADIFGCAAAHVSVGDGDESSLELKQVSSEHSKCPRCWRFTMSDADNSLCHRCSSAINCA